MKKILSLLLCLMLVITMIPTAAFASGNVMTTEGSGYKMSVGFPPNGTLWWSGQQSSVWTELYQLVQNDEGVSEWVYLEDYTVKVPAITQITHACTEKVNMTYDANTYEEYKHKGFDLVMPGSCVPGCQAEVTIEAVHNGNVVAAETATITLGNEVYMIEAPNLPREVAAGESVDFGQYIDVTKRTWTEENNCVEEKITDFTGFTFKMGYNEESWDKVSENDYGLCKLTRTQMHDSWVEIDMYKNGAWVAGANDFGPRERNYWMDWVDAESGTFRWYTDEDEVETTYLLDKRDDLVSDSNASIVFELGCGSGEEFVPFAVQEGLFDLVKDSSGSVNGITLHWTEIQKIAQWDEDSAFWFEIHSQVKFGDYVEFENWKDACILKEIVQYDYPFDPEMNVMVDYGYGLGSQAYGSVRNSVYPEWREEEFPFNSVTSSNSEVARIEEMDGEYHVFGVAPGTAEITVTHEGFDGNTVTKKIAVTVEENPNAGIETWLMYSGEQLADLKDNTAAAGKLIDWIDLSDGESEEQYLYTANYKVPETEDGKFELLEVTGAVASDAKLKVYVHEDVDFDALRESKDITVTNVSGNKFKISYKKGTDVLGKENLYILCLMNEDETGVECLALIEIVPSKTDSGSSGGGYVPVTPPSDNVTNEAGTAGTGASTNADMSQSTTMKGNETTTTVNQTVADKIVEKAVENKSEEVVIDATYHKESAAHSTKAAEVALPTETLQQIAEKTEADVTIKTDVAEIKLDNAAAAAVAQQAEGTTVSVVAEKVKESAKEVRVELKIVCSEGKTISNFDGGSISVTVPAPKGKKDVVCVYIDGQGHMHKVPGQLNEDGTYTFTTGHFSTYAIMDEAEADAAIAAQKEDVKKIKFKLKSKLVTTKNGKKAVKLTWDTGSDLEFDGVAIYRSTKKNSGYGKKPFFTTTKDSYTNTAVKSGRKYYYKVRGYVYIDGEKVYTDYSTKAWRTVK